MKKGDINRIFWIVSIAIFSLYLIFPSVFVSISFRVLGPLFEVSYIVTNKEIEIREDDGEFSSLFVISRPPTTMYDKLVVSLNLEDIKVGDFILSEDGVAIGTVENVGERYASVSLFSSVGAEEKFSINGYVTEGIGLGNGGLLFNVPISIEVGVGDAVIHQESRDVVGNVIQIESQDDIVRNIFSSLNVSPFKLDKVYIRRDYE